MIVYGKALSLEESVYRSLREEILEGRIAAGEALTECAVAQKLGVSRTPIRAALKRLSEEGLISLTPNRGAVVVGVDGEDLVGIYEIRMRLEGLASRAAAERISSEELKRLSDSVELAEFYISKNDTEHLKELDTEFHGIIYRASGNRLLHKTLSELHGNITAYRRLSLSSGDRLEKSVKEHRDILDAIASGDGERADRLTSLHIEAALENLLKVTKGN
jgi:DNA-binding GntR family transcriptional regulator